LIFECFWLLEQLLIFECLVVRAVIDI